MAAGLCNYCGREINVGALGDLIAHTDMAKGGAICPGSNTKPVDKEAATQGLVDMFNEPLVEQAVPLDPIAQIDELLDIHEELITDALRFIKALFDRRHDLREKRRELLAPSN